MARWTQSDEENEHLARIMDRAGALMLNARSTVVLKDGSRLFGKVFPSAVGNNRGQGVPERGWATVKLINDDGEQELDALDIAEIFEKAN